MPVLTLTTDFGETDGYVGAMKGVILTIAPQATLVDITHQIEPGNIRQAAFVLSTAVDHFPANSVHLVVVDPGVGSARRPIAARTALAQYVAPDNGVLSFVLRPHVEDVRIVHLDRPEYWRPEVSHTFHGRDIFAPAAAHLAAGVPLEAVGSAVHDVLSLSPASPEREPDGTLRGEVTHIDHFGNLITNISQDSLAAGPPYQVIVGDRILAGLEDTYAEVEPGEVLVLVGSSGLLEVAVREGNAAEVLGLRVGAPVLLRPPPHERT